MWQFPGGRKIVCHTTLYIINSRLESYRLRVWWKLIWLLYSCLLSVSYGTLHKSGFVLNFIKTDIRYSYFNAAPTSKDYDVYCKFHITWQQNRMTIPILRKPKQLIKRLCYVHESSNITQFCEVTEHSSSTWTNQQTPHAEWRVFLVLVDCLRVWWDWEWQEKY